jgi:hypothetical protein
LCDTGLLQKSRYFDGRVSQAPVAHGEGIRRLTGKIPRAFLFANVTRPQGHHFLASPPLGRPHRRWRQLSVTARTDETGPPKVRKNLRRSSKDEMLEAAVLFPPSRNCKLVTRNQLHSVSVRRIAYRSNSP